ENAILLYLSTGPARDFLRFTSAVLHYRLLRILRVADDLAEKGRRGCLGSGGPSAPSAIFNRSPIFRLARLFEAVTAMFLLLPGNSQPRRGLSRPLRNASAASTPNR